MAEIQQQSLAQLEIIVVSTLIQGERLDRLVPGIKTLDSNPSNLLFGKATLTLHSSSTSNATQIIQTISNVRNSTSKVSSLYSSKVSSNSSSPLR
jgi:hypothetical protein